MQNTTTRRGFLAGSAALLALAAQGALADRALAAQGRDVLQRIADGRSPGTGEDTAPDGEPAVEALRALTERDTVEFGSYPQSWEGEVAPIEWYVLAEQGGGRLLLSKHVLDWKPYNDELADVTWEECSLRAWLNGEFLDAAFTAEERARIVEVELANDPNPIYPEVPSGPATLDRAFCLSLQEVEEYLGVPREDWLLLHSDFDALLEEMNQGVPPEDWTYGKPNEDGAAPHPDIIATPTEWAGRQGATTWHDLDDGDAGVYPEGGTFWWLRSPAEKANEAACVNPRQGYILPYGGGVHTGNGVRPALWLASSAGASSDEYSVYVALTDSFDLLDGFDEQIGAVATDFTNSMGVDDMAGVRDRAAGVRDQIEAAHADLLALDVPASSAYAGTKAAISELYDDLEKRIGTLVEVCDAYINGQDYIAVLSRVNGPGDEHGHTNIYLIHYEQNYEAARPVAP